MVSRSRSGIDGDMYDGKALRNKLNVYEVSSALEMSYSHRELLTRKISLRIPRCSQLLVTSATTSPPMICWNAANHCEQSPLSTSLTAFGCSSLTVSNSRITCLKHATVDARLVHECDYLSAGVKSRCSH